jgi:hypothetical protein
MLGPEYETAWELDRSALEESHFYTHSLPRGHLKHTNFETIAVNLQDKMHLPSGDLAMQFGNVPATPVEKDIPSNGEAKPQQDVLALTATVKEEDSWTKPNEARIPCPQNLSSEEVLDTILTAWAILIQRYQRDVFHQFTWGTGAAEDKRDDQCIQTTDLDLSNQVGADSLKTKLSSVRSSSITFQQGSSIFLNDGTNAEVSIPNKFHVYHG